MNKEINENKIGIALCGGGLQGFSHIGAIRALEELGIDIKLISGTSSGSLIAGLYAAGFNTYEMEEICRKEYKKILKVKNSTILKIIWNYLFFKETRTEGLIDGKYFEKMIDTYAAKKKIAHISNIKDKKLAIATVDTKTMKECLFVSDILDTSNNNINYIENVSLGKAIRASMAFPGIFTTVNLDNYNFIDGGTIDNLPTQVLKDMGAEKIIAIDFDLSKYTPSNNLENVVLRALDIFSYGDVKKGQEVSDISIEIYNPDTGLVKLKDFEKTVKRGYDAVMERKQEIIKLIENSYKIVLENK